MIKGLSGGERKRTAIGVELITNPQVIFCDEPTSGLDTFTATKIVKILIKQANLGKAVISTIHQPSSETYALFGNLLLLAEGNIIYQGPAKDAVKYFRDQDFLISRNVNPADYFLRQFYIPYMKDTIVKRKLNKVITYYNQTQRQEHKKQKNFADYDPNDFISKNKGAGFCK
jgi:ABC-type multidrug transport system ATPase subunit